MSLLNRGLFMAMAVLVSTAGCSELAGLGPERELLAQRPGGSGGGEGLGGEAPGPCGGSDWQRTYGDAQGDNIAFVVPAPDDGTYVSGSFRGAIDIEQPALVSVGEADMFVARLDACGDTVWAKRFGTAGWDGRPDLATHPEGVLLCGVAHGPVDLGAGAPPSAWAGFVSLFSPSGEHQWTRWMEGAACEAVAVDPLSGDVVVLGFFEEANTVRVDGVTLTSLGGNDLFLLRVDGQSGAVTHHRQIGSTAYDGAPALAVGAQGRVLIGGNTLGELDFGDGPEPHLDQDAFVALLKPDFSPLWAHVYPFAGVQAVSAVAFSTEGDVMVAGNMDGSIDLGAGLITGSASGFIARLAPEDGQGRVSRSLDGLTFVWSLTARHGGGVSLSGGYHGTLNLDGTPRMSAGEGDAVAATFDDQLALTWSLLPPGSPWTDSFFAVSIDSKDRLTVGGSFRGTLPPIGAHPAVSSMGDDDAVLLRIAP